MKNLGFYEDDENDLPEIPKVKELNEKNEYQERPVSDESKRINPLFLTHEEFTKNQYKTLSENPSLGQSYFNDSNSFMIKDEADSFYSNEANQEDYFK